MSTEALSAAVKSFLCDHIQSVEQMEILALMLKWPERQWTAKSVDEELRTNEQSIGRRLERFVAAGVLIKTGAAEATYRYQPRSPELAAAAVQTVEAYRVRPVLVIETIFRPQGNSAQNFADAFRLRPQKDG